MKRILILNFEFPPLGGGGGVAAHKLAKGFIENGYEVDYLTSGFGDLRSFEVVDGINIYRVSAFGRNNLSEATMLSMFSYLVFGFFKGTELCSRYDYEFINTHFVIPTGPLGFILSKLFARKNILSLHGGDIYDPAKNTSPHRHWYLRGAIRFLLNRADRIVAQSSNTKDNCQKFYDPRKEISVIPLAYEPIAFKKVDRRSLGLQDDKKYLIGVGRLVKRKDFETFVKALSFLDQSVEGLIIGEGPERGAILNEAERMNMSSRLHLLGRIDEAKKFQYLSNANVFVLSSLHEGFGIVVQEAMQVGLPIVSTDSGGQTDLVREGKNGYLVPTGDANKMAEAIRRCLSEGLPEIDTDMNRFSPKLIAEEYLKIIGPIKKQ